MEVWWLTPGQGAEARTVAELPELLRREDGFVWVDVAHCWPGDAQVLRDVFGFHALAVQDCVKRNQVPKVHAYADHVFVVLHAPERGRNGHVHYVELDQFVGPNYVVTVHGPTNEAVGLERSLADTAAVRHRVESGRFRPASPSELSYAIVSTLARRQEAFVEQQTGEVWRLEQTVSSGHLGDPEKFLEEMFRARHGLVTGRTMAVAAERLAVIAVITLPVTALSSIYGMNLIVNDSTHVGQLVPVLLVMLAMSVCLLIWARRQGWW
ncbi:CorA family divalent cation transporter [Symbioplanes lichenis]|uniref:CorA family divalent cation transporter n=1 Tax=Symbioplanes lichenis TaxID=1629072 RepID=UPI0027397B61|nr:CorA family divalent cation transporter [Actinoplanes lichenis]